MTPNQSPTSKHPIVTRKLILYQTYDIICDALFDMVNISGRYSTVLEVGTPSPFSVYPCSKGTQEQIDELNAINVTN